MAGGPVRVEIWGPCKFSLMSKWGPFWPCWHLPIAGLRLSFMAGPQPLASKTGGCLHGVIGKIPLPSNISKIISPDRRSVLPCKILLWDEELFFQPLAHRAGESFQGHFWNLALPGFPPIHLSNNPSQREGASYFTSGSFYVPGTGSLFCIYYIIQPYINTAIYVVVFLFDA